MRRHPDTNAVLTFPVRHKVTGAEMKVDDRTFDRAKHEPLNEADAPDFVPGAPVESAGEGESTLEGGEGDGEQLEEGTAESETEGEKPRRKRRKAE